MWWAGETIYPAGTHLDVSLIHRVNVKILGVASGTYNSSAWEMETGRSLGLAGWLVYPTW